ncbi:MAG: cytochrome c biogenesis protein CcsA [Deltaproteobacteria bacterium]|nr:cytochrome c biogenesis protein CcsA [Deltaproteobacteria bacterium]
MNQLISAIFVASAASYLASCALFVARIRRSPTTHLRPQWPPRLLEIGAGLHLTYLVLYSVVDRLCPLFSLHSALGIVSLVGVVAYAILSRGRRLDALGGFVAALAALFLVTAHGIGARPTSTGDRWLVAVHITANLLGGGVLLVAGCASAFYLWSERRLRRRRSLARGPRLPPLESLDAVVHRLLWFGVPLLTIGIVTGRMVIEHVETVSAGERVRAVLSIASWLLLLAVLLLRQLRGWRGRRPAYAALGGAVGILLVIALYVARALLGDGG